MWESVLRPRRGQCWGNEWVVVVVGSRREPHPQAHTNQHLPLQAWRPWEDLRSPLPVSSRCISGKVSSGWGEQDTYHRKLPGPTSPDRALCSPERKG